MANRLYGTNINNLASAAKQHSSMFISKKSPPDTKKARMV